jgi:uncharacterized membrane protein
MPSPTRYPRQGENPDFGRVVFFTDAVFAIAMTLLVVEVGVPEAAGNATDDPGALLDLLQDKVPLVMAFYLAFVALLPFPTGVLGEYGSNPVSVVAFAANMIAVSAMEAVLFRHAWRRRLLREEWPEGRLPVGDAGVAVAADEGDRRRPAGSDRYLA